MAAVIAVIYAHFSVYKLVEIGQERKKAHGENVAQLTANWSGRGRAHVHFCSVCVCICVHVFCAMCVYIYIYTWRISIKEKRMEESLMLFIGHFFEE